MLGYYCKKKNREHLSSLALSKNRKGYFIRMGVQALGTFIQKPEESSMDILGTRSLDEKEPDRAKESVGSQPFQPQYPPWQSV